MKKHITLLILLLIAVMASGQDTLIIPKGTTNLATITSPATPAGQFENLLIKGRSAPGLLRISDNFGKETPIFSIGGDLAFKMYSDPARSISGSLLIQNSAGEDVFRFRQDGSIRFTKITTQSINTGKVYHIPVIDEVGNLVYIRVSGSVLGYLYR